MGFLQCISVCLLSFNLGFITCQETVTNEPITMDDNPPEITLPQAPETSTNKPITMNEDHNMNTFHQSQLGNPPFFPPPKNHIHSKMLIKEELGGFHHVNPTLIGAEELHQGDVLLSPEQKRELLERKAIRNSNRRWTNGENGLPLVHYRFGDEDVKQSAVLAGIAHWAEHTCIVFQQTSETPTNYLNFFKGSGCWSYIGMQSGPQDISIGNGCNGLGTVVHEIGHAMGFYHEQARSDRDDYVTIHFENVKSNKVKNFDKTNDDNHTVPYDLNSVMHYGAEYFSANGKNTITSKNPMAQELIGNKVGLSHYDKLLANTMYPCISTWMATCNIDSNPCLNDGYVGKDCNCICPSGTRGTNCEIVDQSYYDSLLGDCSEKITIPQTITSPNYPSKYDKNTKCTKWIVAPECNRVDVTFSAFRLYGYTNNCGGNSCCFYDYLEIRSEDLSMGDKYCHKDIAINTTFISQTNELILYFSTKTNYYNGWSADVTFVPMSPESCATSPGP